MTSASQDRTPDAALVARLRAAGCVFAEEEALLLQSATTDAAELERLVAQRVAGEPLEYLLGWAEFAGLRIRVAPGVFVPRRRTELLLDLGLELLGPSPAAHSGRADRTGRAEGMDDEGLRILDLCCGAAPLATAIAARLPTARVLAADLDPDAAAVARENLAPFGARAEVRIGDLFSAVPAERRGSFGLIVVNAPYVPSEQIALMPPEAREHEHRIALDGGADGLELHRRVAAETSGWLAPGGTLVIETSGPQAARSLALFEERGLVAHIVHDEDRSATAVVARKAAEPK